MSAWSSSRHHGRLQEVGGRNPARHRLSAGGLEGWREMDSNSRSRSRKQGTFWSWLQNLRSCRAQSAEAPPVSSGLRPRMSLAIFLSRLCSASSTSIGGSTLRWRFATVQPIRTLAKKMASLTRARSSWRPPSRPRIHERMRSPTSDFRLYGTAGNLLCEMLAEPLPADLARPR
jgi:hypothetical protein